MISTKLFYLIIVLSFLLTNGNTSEVQGIVFEDKNNNSKFDAGETGIPEIAVSNQEDVVLSDKDGKFSLNIGEETIIFLTKPSGYKVPVNSENLPQFFYIHQPAGSPELKFSGIEPTGKLPKQIEFPLFKSEDSDTFEVIVFSDPQPRNSKEISYIRDDVVSELIGSTAKCGIVLGDVMYDDISLYSEYNNVISQIGIPFYNVAGNHDMNYDSPDDQYSLETFKKYFGPNYYSFDYGEVHFIVLDDIEWNGQDSTETNTYLGKIGTRQLHWLKNDLNVVPENKLIVLTMHIPIYTFISENKTVNILDRELLFNILKDRKHLLALAGHMHLTEHQYLNKDIGWDSPNPFHQIICASVSGSWWGGKKDERGIPIADQRDGVPNGYHIFRFEGNKYTEYYKGAGLDKNNQIRISAPVGSFERYDQLKLEIIANVFNGSEKSIVEYSLDDSPFLPMINKIMTDPYFENIHSRHIESYASWIKPRKSNHIWTATLSDKIKTGIHKITIRTIDQYKNKYKKSGLFEIVKSEM